MDKNKKTTYTTEFKIKGVKLYLEDGYGYQRASCILGIPDKKTLRLWVKNYKELGLPGLAERRGKSEAPFKGRPTTSPMSIEEENRILKMENEFLKKVTSFSKEHSC